MHRLLAFSSIFISLLAAGCSGSDGVDSASGGTARVALDDATYEVRDVAMTMATGDDAWFRIDGAPTKGAKEDCAPGLGSGLGLYGDLPPSVHAPADLVGQRMKVDFTGDGDDANFCFVGMGGLAGAEDAWITIQSVTGSRVTFSMKGTFKIYDENGNGPIKSATASGTAILRTET
jgi:hypothetical protein